MHAVAAILTVLLMVQAQGGVTPEDAREWTIGCSADAAISPQTARDDLVKRYGAENVTDGDVYVGEGFSEPGTILFKDEPLRRLNIRWSDEAAQRFPRAAIAGRPDGIRLDRASMWQTAEGITLGTTLKEIERLNRRPFRLAGLGWDYSGTVMRWGGGALERTSEGACRLLVRLEPDQESYSRAQWRTYGSLAGQREFSSGHPSMQELNPTVYQLGIWVPAVRAPQ